MNRDRHRAGGHETRRRWVGAVLVAVVVLVACSGDDSGAGVTGTTVPASDGAPATGDVFVESESSSDTDVEASSQSTSAADRATTTAIPTVPDTGVPGLESADEFCRSWSEFAGTFQALAVAWAVGGDERRAATNELAAAPALLAAVGGMAAAFPSELAEERDAVLDGLLGPMTRRAERARSELDAAGLTAAEIDVLGDAWLTTLAERGTDDPALAVAIPPSVDAQRLDAAVTAFVTSVPAIDLDPSLVTDVTTPATDAYLAANCPDRGTLAGNDEVDQS